MRWPWMRRKTSPDLEHARRERRRAEELLARDREHVIIPLREMRAVNHIQDDISRLIARRVRREGGDG